ncbi:SGNH hydrolase-type esterase domain-containing protein [Nemania sp. NC0429]|nr:SGNH hydrolase-type esterase domain-containing protein [Nemania sp. NC0429]
MTVDIDKPQPSLRRGRLAFLRTKRAIAALTALVIVAVILIALGATHVLTPRSHNSIASAGNNSSVNGNGSAGDSGSGRNDSSPDQGGDPTQKPGNWRPQNSSTIANGTPLRIMCLGASIVLGEWSSDSNGFRKTFRADLAKLGAPINMVGSQRYGHMADNDLEAYPGNRVMEIYDRAKQGSVSKLKPNVFVINVGTNNVIQRRETDVAGRQLEAFVNFLLRTSPRATVVLSTLIPNNLPDREPIILDINRQYREVFKKYSNKPVVLAELHPSAGLPGRPQAGDIGRDGSHPTDKGYEIMGHLLAQAVMDADARGYLRWPEDGVAYDGDLGRVEVTGTQSSPPMPAKTALS